MPHIQRGFLSLPCCVFHRMAFPVVSEWYQYHSCDGRGLKQPRPTYVLLVLSYSIAPITITLMAHSFPARSVGVTLRVAKTRPPNEWRLNCTLGNSCRPL